MNVPENGRNDPFCAERDAKPYQSVNQPCCGKSANLGDSLTSSRVGATRDCAASLQLCHVVSRRLGSVARFVYINITSSDRR